MVVRLDLGLCILLSKDFASHGVHRGILSCSPFGYALPHLEVVVVVVVR